MRQVFSSPRIENVEGVAKLLRDEGIVVRISDGRSYRSAIRGNFSYRDNAEAAAPRPAVWIVHSEDQPRARQLLRDAGLLHTPGMPLDSYVPETPHMRNEKKAALAAQRTSRIRYGLLAATAVLIALVFLSMRPTPEAVPVVVSVAPVSTSAPVTAPATTYVVATPPALAETLFAAELEAQGAELACLAIDGADPAAALVAGLGRQGTEVRAGSACTAGPARGSVFIDVARYRTDGSGVGTIEIVTRRGREGEPAQDETRRLEVERMGDLWRVLRVLD